MIALERKLVQAFHSGNKFCSSSRSSILPAQMRSVHINSKLLKSDVADKSIRQGFHYLPKNQNFLLSKSSRDQSMVFYSNVLTQACRNNILLLGNSIQRESRAQFHSEEDRTYVTLLNREENASLMVDSYSQQGFRMNNGLAVVGAIALFPKSLLSWNVGTAADITQESLSLFYMLAPKIDLLVLGIGDPGTKFDISLLPFMRNKGISLEVMPTEKAVATYNFLTEEGRSVAGAFIPPHSLRPTAEDHADAIMKKRQLFETNIDDQFL